MGIGSRAILAASLGFAVSFVVACGGGKGLLSSDQANTLNDQLSSVSQAVADGHCGRASAASRKFSNQVAALPSTVNTTLVQNLGQGATTVSKLAAKDCRSSSSSSSTTSSSSTPASTSTTTVTSTATATTSTNPTSSSSSSSSSTTETNPTSSSSSSTSSNGGAGLGGAGTGGNGNGQ